MAKRKYDDDYKLATIRTYLNSPYGIRTVAKALGLPSKNYITDWMAELKEKGLIPKDLVKDLKKSSYSKTDARNNNNEFVDVSPREKALLVERVEMKAEIDILKEMVKIMEDIEESKSVKKKNI